MGPPLVPPGWGWQGACSLLSTWPSLGDLAATAHLWYTPCTLSVLWYMPCTLSALRYMPCTLPALWHTLCTLVHAVYTLCTLVRSGGEGWLEVQPPTPTTGPLRTLQGRLGHPVIAHQRWGLDSPFVGRGQVDTAIFYGVWLE